MNTYFKAVQGVLDEVFREEQQALENNAFEIKTRIEKGGIIQLFGCGHSHLLAEEGYYRAGSLIPVQPIFVESLMLHKGALRSSDFEKDPTFFQTFKDELDIREHDVVIIISNSGRNPVPIDMAHFARKAGAYTVSIQSLHYNELDHPSRHESGSRLEAVVDDKLNTHVPVGDGLLTEGGLRFGPGSSVAANALLHGTFSRVVEMMIAEGQEPPVFRSGNVDGNKDYNAKMIEKYGKRIQF